MNRFEWVIPVSAEAAAAQLGHGAAIKAGGVDLMDLMKERIVAPSRLVNFRAVRGLEGITDGDEGLRLGPLETLARIAADDRIRSRYRALAAAAGHAATSRRMTTPNRLHSRRSRRWRRRRPRRRLCETKTRADRLPLQMVFNSLSGKIHWHHVPVPSGVTIS